MARARHIGDPAIWKLIDEPALDAIEKLMEKDFEEIDDMVCNLNQNIKRKGNENKFDFEIQEVSRKL